MANKASLHGRRPDTRRRTAMAWLALFAIALQAMVPLAQAAAAQARAGMLPPAFAAICTGQGALTLADYLTRDDNRPQRDAGVTAAPCGMCLAAALPLTLTDPPALPAPRRQFLGVEPLSPKPSTHGTTPDHATAPRGPPANA